MPVYRISLRKKDLIPMSPDYEISLGSGALHNAANSILADLVSVARSKRWITDYGEVILSENYDASIGSNIFITRLDLLYTINRVISEDAPREHKWWEKALDRLPPTLRRYFPERDDTIPDKFILTRDNEISKRFVDNNDSTPYSDMKALEKVLFIRYGETVMSQYINRVFHAHFSPVFYNALVEHGLSEEFCVDFLDGWWLFYALQTALITVQYRIGLRAF